MSLHFFILFILLLYCNKSVLVIRVCYFMRLGTAYSGLFVTELATMTFLLDKGDQAEPVIESLP